MYTKAFFPNFEKVMKEVFDVDFDHYTDESRLTYTRPAANVKSLEDRYIIELAVPGLDKSDIKIKLDKNILWISSEKEIDSEKNYKNKEFKYGKFKRKFTLSDKADTNEISANMEKGILSVSIMKKKEAQDFGPKEINID